MKYRIVVAMALGSGLMVAGQGWAQSNPYNGQWRATFSTARGMSADGTVVVQDSGGSWDMNTSSPNNPCSGRKAPIEVSTADAEQLVFEVKRSKVLTGCGDTLMSLKPTDANTLKGQFNQREFTLTRKP